MEIVEEASAPVAAAATAAAATVAVTPVTSAATQAVEPPPPVVSQEQLEAVVRKVLAEMTDGLVREIVTARVLDVAERLVREEIERLKAAAEADQA